MAINFKINDHGFNSLLEKGVYETFTSFALTDSLKMYNVSAKNELLDVFDRTGSHTPFSDQQHCLNSEITPIAVNEITEEDQIKNDTRAVMTMSYTNCDNPYEGTNLKFEVDVAEWFQYLKNLPSQDFVKSTKASLKFFDKVSYELQTYSLYEDRWVSEGMSTNFIPTIKMLGGTAKELPKFTSRWVMVNDQVNNTTQDRFSTPIIIDIQRKGVSGLYLEGQELNITFMPPTIGAVVNGDSNFVDLNRVTNITEYKTFKPAVALGTNITDIYSMEGTTNYSIEDSFINPFLGHLIWNFTNREDKSAIVGMVEKATNAIEFRWKETSVGVYELNLQFQWMPDATVLSSVKKVIGGFVELKFIYDTTKSVSGVWDNIVSIIE